MHKMSYLHSIYKDPIPWEGNSNRVWKAVVERERYNHSIIFKNEEEAPIWWPNCRLECDGQKWDHWKWLLAHNAWIWAECNRYSIIVRMQLRIMFRQDQYGYLLILLDRKWKKEKKNKTREKKKNTISKHMAMVSVVLNLKKLRIPTRFCEVYFLWSFWVWAHASQAHWVSLYAWN